MSHTNKKEILRVFEKAIDAYLAMPAKRVEEAKNVTPKMHQDRVISLPYINRKLANTDSFIRYKDGSRGGIQECLRLMVNSGVLVEVTPQVALVDYDSAAKLYYIK